MGEQFGRIPAAVVRAGGLRAKVRGKPLPPSALAAYIVILTFASRNWKTRISHQKIAELTGVTRTSAASATTTLIEAGLVRQVKRGGSAAGASVYEVVKCWQTPTLEVSSVTRPSVGNHPSKCRQSPTPSDFSSDFTSEEERKCATHTVDTEKKEQPRMPAKATPTVAESGKTRRRVPPPARPMHVQIAELKTGASL